MKTISDLNKNWWYRLLKVFYCLVFLIILVISAFAVFDSNKTYLAPDLKITCDYGNGSTFNAFHDKGISIVNYDPYKEIPSDINAKILAACGITQADIVQATADAKEQAIKQYNDEGCATTQNGFKSLFCPVLNSSAPYQTFNMYKMPSTVVPVSTYGKALGYTLLDIIVVLLVFEAFRRVFYYIALGRIRPPK